jgi:hypothetical protein
MTQFYKTTGIMILYLAIVFIQLPSGAHSEETFIKGAWHTPFSVAPDYYCPDLDWDNLDSLGITHVLTWIKRTGPGVSYPCADTILKDIGDRDIKVYASGWLVGDNDCDTREEIGRGCGDDLTWYAASGWAMLDAAHENTLNPCREEEFYDISHMTGVPFYDNQVNRTIWRAIPDIHGSGYMLKHFTGYDAYWKWERRRYGIIDIKITNITGEDTLKVARLEVWMSRERSSIPCDFEADSLVWSDILTLSDFPEAGVYKPCSTYAARNSAIFKGNHDYQVYWYGNKEIWIDQIECRDVCTDTLFGFSETRIDSLKDIVDYYYEMNPGTLVGWYVNDEPFLNQLAPLDTVKTKIIDASTYNVTNMAAVSVPQFFNRYLTEVENITELVHDEYRLYGDRDCDGDINTDTLSYPYQCDESVQVVYDTLAARFQKAKEVADSREVPFWAVIQVQAENRPTTRTECINRYGGEWYPLYRDPIAGELRAQVYLALAYGAKAIWYFLYPSIYQEDDQIIKTVWEYQLGWDPDTLAYIPYWYRGLIDKAYGADCYTSKNYKYYVVQGINDTLNVFSPILLDSQTNWDIASSSHPNSLPIVGSNLVIEDVTAENPSSGGPDPPEHTYVQVGIFTSSERFNPDYLMIVNRRSTAAETREITLDIRKEANRKYLIEDILSGQEVLKETNENSLFSYNITIDPGYGHLVKITEVRTDTIKQNETWSGDVLMIGDVTVASNATLTLNDGTKIYVRPNYDYQGSGIDSTKSEVIVDGKLIAKGLPSSTISFQSQAETPTAGDWYGIRLNSGSVDTLKNAVVKDANTGVRLSSANNAYIDSCEITNSQKFGIYSKLSTYLRVKHSLIEDNGMYGIALNRTSATIKNNIIKGHSRYNIGVNVAAHSTENVRLEGNTVGGIDSEQEDPYGIAYELVDYGLTGNDDPQLVIINNPGIRFCDQLGIEIIAPDTVGELTNNSQIIGNEAWNNKIGIGIDGGHALVLKNNIVRDNNQGVLVFEVNSIGPVLGKEVTEQSPIGGDNSFYNNSSYSVKNVDSSDTLLAEHNWWGAVPPDTSKIQGLVDYEPYLTSDPNSEGKSGSGGTNLMSASRLPRVYSLFQNYPNPFNPLTTIKYDIPFYEEAGVLVKIHIYNLRGQLIRKLMDKERDPGFYQIVWDGRDERGGTVASGIYFYKIQAGKFISTKKMMVVR